MRDTLVKVCKYFWSNWKLQNGKQCIPLIKIMRLCQTESAITNFMSRNITNDNILESINSLYSKQRDFVRCCL